MGLCPWTCRGLEGGRGQRTIQHHRSAASSTLEAALAEGPADSGRWKLYEAFWGFLMALGGHTQGPTGAPSAASFLFPDSRTAGATHQGQQTHQMGSFFGFSYPLGGATAGAPGADAAWAKGGTKGGPSSGTERVLRSEAECCLRTIFRLVLLSLQDPDLAASSSYIPGFQRLLPMLLNGAPPTDTLQASLQLFLWYASGGPALP